MTEMCLRRRLERSDELRFLAAMTETSGYEPPDERLAGYLDELDGGQDVHGSAARFDQITAAAEALGGEVG